MQLGKFNTVVDAAHGSSAKGAVSTRLVEIFKVPNVSTCNYMNAGHTTVFNGQKFVAKCLPTPASLNMVGRGRPTLWIGPGSGFFPEQLDKEMYQTNYLWTQPGLMIHERAIICSDRHVYMEQPGGLQSTEYISSTMSGSGAAFAEKAMRRPEVVLANTNYPTLVPVDFINSVREELKAGRAFLHEVSQGFALSINHGTHYPYCTFRDCTPQQAYADFMLLPSMIGDIYLNVRSFPIRVGSNFDASGKQVGYSGDFCDDQVETTWEQIAKDAEMPPDEAAALAERERTTVTKKIRRVATQSWSLLQNAAKATGATKLVLNFPQYIHWSAYRMRGGTEMLSKLHPKVRAYLDKMEDTTGLKVCMIGTSAEHDDYIWLD
jgi:adenylosuccinate synthase